MFDAEKLLGKIVGDVIGSKGKKGSLTDTLTSGAGLMTMVGLGVGAMEILKGQKNGPGGGNQPPVPPPAGVSAPPAPPPAPGTGTPPAPPKTGAPTPPVPPPAPGAKNDAAPTADELARRMIQVMIAAAHADGAMDEQEKQAVLDKLESQGLEPEEKDFLVAEMDSPPAMDRLVAGITDPGTCRTMYMLAVATITIDTPEERAWLDELAARLGISDDLKGFIEEQYGR